LYAFGVPFRLICPACSDRCDEVVARTFAKAFFQSKRTAIPNRWPEARSIPASLVLAFLILFVVNEKCFFTDSIYSVIPAPFVAVCP
jgi:hypothetical protein